jgi:type I restriction enzyme S subunit
VEQRRIVEMLEDRLSRLDVATSTLRASLRRLDVLRRLVVMDLAVGAVASLKSLAVDSGYGTSTKCQVGGAGSAVVRIPNLLSGRIDLSDEKRAADPSIDLSSVKLAAGDVLIVRTNGSKDLIGRSAVVQEGVEAAFASYLIRYRVDTEKIRPAWLHAMLGSPALRAEIESLAASSAGQHNLSLGKLDGLPIPTPAIDEQDAALARLAELDYHRELLRSAVDGALRRSEDLRRSILAAAFRGELTERPSSAA